LIHNEKQVVLFEKNCNVTEKSEAIAQCKEAGHPGQQGGAQEKNHWKKGEGQGVIDSPTK
jgi:hypothetical protein